MTRTWTTSTRSWTRLSERHTLDRKAVSSIYSVLIQNKKTMDQFHQFYPLFMEAINEERIGLCRWTEAGTTVDTALPELCDLIDGKEEWRAVVIRVEDEDAMRACACDPLNPYNFPFAHRTREQGCLESPIPLVRLTQMLGGVPRPSMQFQAMGERYAAHAPAPDAEAEAEYDRLCEQYAYDGIAPSELWLISVRKDGARLREKAQRSRSTVREYSAEGFWQRNQYPSMCRFMVFDTSKQGNSQKLAERLNFWMTVLLLTGNDIPASSLQAYGLYRVGVACDKEAMAEVFQKKVLTMRVASKTMEAQMEHDSKQRLRDQENMSIPNYTIAVEIKMDQPNTNGLLESPGQFGLLPADNRAEQAAWAEHLPRANAQFAKQIVQMERAVDRTAAGVKSRCAYEQEAVQELNAYQTEDLYSALDRTRDNIIDLRGQLPGIHSPGEEALAKADKRVRDELELRVTQQQFWHGAIFLLIAAFLSNVPALVYSLVTGSGNPVLLVLVLVVQLLAFAVAAPIVLSAQAARLRAAVQNYNEKIAARVAELALGMRLYSAFLSKVASHMHGSSYMNILQGKTFDTEMAADDMRRHQKEITKFIYKLRTWGAALHLRANFNLRVDPSDVYTINTDVPPAVNPEYTLQYGKSCRTVLYPSGGELDSPLSFVRELKIVQEEIYDDPTGNP